jgi:GNAT superfamily N-acetyltransferase
MSEAANEWNGLTINREHYSEYINDIKVLLPQHWKELALYQDDIPLAPDYDFYKRADFAGMLAFFAIRHVESHDLVGYAVYFIKAHHHYLGQRWAISDIFWLHPDLRNGGVGKWMFAYVENELKKLGAVVMHTTLKKEHPAAAYVLEALGHTQVELGYSKKLI